MFWHKIPFPINSLVKTNKDLKVRSKHLRARVCNQISCYIHSLCNMQQKIQTNLNPRRSVPGTSTKTHLKTHRCLMVALWATACLIDYLHTDVNNWVLHIQESTAVARVINSLMLLICCPNLELCIDPNSVIDGIKIEWVVPGVKNSAKDSLCCLKWLWKVL